MATMIGRMKRRNWHINCDCISSRSIKGAEERRWRKEAEDEIDPQKPGACPHNLAGVCDQCLEDHPGKVYP